MKTFQKILGVLFLSIVLLNCSKKSDDTNQGGSAPTVSTPAAENVNVTSATLICVINSTGNLSITRHGVCYGLDHNPTVSNITAEAGNTDIGSHSFNVTVPESNKTYYARAYAENSAGLTYGNEISFSSSYGITSQPVTNIVPTSALFRGNTATSTSYTVSWRGFVYNTTPNPTMSNQYVSSGPGFGDFTCSLLNLTANTVYYAKPFFTTNTNSDVHYGEEISFKTTGYFGSAACYVVYDKGEVTDGWRYLEISPVGIDYDITWTNGAKWGCTGLFLSLTYPEIGTGLANTQRIVSQCAAANCAARLCDNYTHSGYNDWFLASKDEMLMAAKALESIGIHTQYSWTSTENNTTESYVINYPLLGNDYVVTTGPKDAERYVYPMRRY